MGTIAEKLQKLVHTKEAIRQAIIGKGQNVAASDTFASYPAKIAAIKTGTDISDATATAGDLRSGKVGYGKDGKIVGTVPDVAVPTPVISVSSGGLITASATQNTGFVAGGSTNATKQLTTQGAMTWTPRTYSLTVPSGTYMTGNLVVQGDSNLKPENIKSGVTIFGITGTAKGSEGVVGTYKGQQTLKVSTTQDIVLGFQPKFVFVSDAATSFNRESPWYYYEDTDDAGDNVTEVWGAAAYAFIGAPMKTLDVNGSTINCLEITANGFRVANGYNTYRNSSGTLRRNTNVSLNDRNSTYMYIAVP